MSLYFHGSISAIKLPETVLDALAQASPDATLTVVGYETVGEPGHMRAFLERAQRLGLSQRACATRAPSRVPICCDARTSRRWSGDLSRRCRATST